MSVGGRGSGWNCSWDERERRIPVFSSECRSIRGLPVLMSTSQYYTSTSCIHSVTFTQLHTHTVILCYTSIHSALCTVQSQQHCHLYTDTSYIIHFTKLCWTLAPNMCFHTMHLCLITHTMSSHNTLPHKCHTFFKVIIQDNVLNSTTFVFTYMSYLTSYAYYSLQCFFLHLCIVISFPYLFCVMSWIATYLWEGSSKITLLRSKDHRD